MISDTRSNTPEYGTNLIIRRHYKREGGEIDTTQHNFKHYYCPVTRTGRILLLLLKKCWQCKAGRERLTPYQSEDPRPTTPTHRIKEEKVKTVGDKKGASSYTNKKALALLLKSVSATPSTTRSPRLFHMDTDKRIKILRYCEVLQRGGA